MIRIVGLFQHFDYISIVFQITLPISAKIKIEEPFRRTVGSSQFKQVVIISIFGSYNPGGATAVDKPNIKVQIEIDIIIMITDFSCSLEEPRLIAADIKPSLIQPPIRRDNPLRQAGCEVLAHFS